MAFVAPTPTTFKARFPSFAAVPDVTVQLVLDEAIGKVGPTWTEDDRAPAVLYLTAHLLTMEGFGEANPGGGGTAATGAVRRRKVGDVETEFATYGRASGGTSVLEQYNLTVYGRRYLEYLRVNFPPLLVV